MILLDTDPDRDTEEGVGGNRSPRWFLAAAGVLVIIAIAVVVLVTRDDGSDTAASSSEPEDPGERFDAAEDLASRFMAAFDPADGDAAMSLLADDAPIRRGQQSVSPEEVGRWFEFLATLGERHDLQGCDANRLTDPGDPVQVTCHTAFSTRLTRAVGVEPIDSTFFVRVEGDQITALRSGIDLETFGPMVFQPFFTFVQDHADDGDIGKMFESHPDGAGFIGPKLTEESIALHDRFTSAFEAANDSG